MSTELAPAEGLQYAATHTMSGATVFMGLLFGKTVGAGTITSASTLSGLSASEENGTTYVRISTTLGAASSGVMVVPSNEFNNSGNTNWHSNVSAAFLASLITGGVFIFVWDLTSGTADMSGANADLLIPSVNYFLQNPGGI